VACVSGELMAEGGGTKAWRTRVFAFFRKNNLLGYLMIAIYLYIIHWNEYFHEAGWSSLDRETAHLGFETLL